MPRAEAQNLRAEAQNPRGKVRSPTIFASTLKFDLIDMRICAQISAIEEYFGDSERFLGRNVRFFDSIFGRLPIDSWVWG